MNTWPFGKTIIISRCFWDYYLQVFQKEYAYELAHRHGVEVVWVDRPTRNPVVWLRERKRVIDGIKVLRPWALHNEYEMFTKWDQIIFDLQLKKYLSGSSPTALWSVCCLHPWLSKQDCFDSSIYWPGDHFDPVGEYNDYKDYSLVMPWVGMEDIPDSFKGIRFESSTCAGKAFMSHADSPSINPQFLNFSDKYEHKVSYIGGLSYDRFDFELMSFVASSMPNCAFLLGAKSDGLPETSFAISLMLKKHKNIRIFEDLKYHELASLVSISEAGIIPYRIRGQNLRICPNKFFEYSAMGKSTVCTSIPSMQRFSPPARVAKSEVNFVQLLKESINHSLSQEKIIELKSLAEFASPRETIRRIIGSLNNP